MPGDDENIIAISSFRYLLKSVQCTQSSVTLTFNDNGAYSYAKNAWQWVGVDKNRTFVLVAGAGDCGWNTVRQPFVISTIAFDDPDKTINLQGNASTWKNVAHTYELWVGKIPSPPSRFKRRDIDEQLSIDFNHPFPTQSQTFPLPSGVSVTLGCDNCGTQGSFDFDFHVQQVNLVPTAASVSLRPQGVGASLTPELGLSANFTGSFTDEISLGKISVDGITIPGPPGSEDILDVGPQIFFSLGFILGPLQGSASISAGVSVGIPDSSYVDISLIPLGISASGWTPTVSPIPFVVNGQISASAQDYAKVGVELAIDALGKCY